MTADQRESPDATDSLATLSVAYRAAERAGKPLVILVIPEDTLARWKRGELFSDYLTDADDFELAPLALAEVTWARRTTARLLLPMLPAPDAKDAGAEPLFLVVETAAVPATVQVIAAPPVIPELPGGMGIVAKGKSARQQCQDKEALVARWRKELGTPADEPLLHWVLKHCAGRPTKAKPGQVVPVWGMEHMQKEDQVRSLVRLRIRTLARLLDRALAADAATLHRRRDELLARLPAEEARAATLLGHSAQALAQLPPAEADRLAALLLLRSAEETDAGARSALSRALAKAAAARRRERPVSGIHWTQSSGCGTSPVERALGIACGMGHVPAKSARFLYFFTRGY